MEKKYRILRIVATIWKVLAWIVLVISVLGGCASIAFGVLAGGAGSSSNNTLAPLLGGAIGGAISGLIAIFIGVLYFVSLYAFAELVDVMLALEENTRATAEQLKNLAKA
jgi:hypothetical protein